MPGAPSATKREEPPRRETSSGISRTIVNFWLDATLAVIFLALVWVTFVLRFAFPRPTAAAGWKLWGYGYDDWMNLQFIVLILQLLATLLHVMLHWTWVCGVITGKLLPRGPRPPRWEDGTRTVVGVSLLVVIVNVLGGLMALAALMIRPPA